MLSVIIPTRNRARSLEQCLAHFSRSNFHGLHNWELIVVDNNSDDDTPAVIDKSSRAFPFTIKYAYEGRTGISHARNRGIAEATQPIIAFTDDDCFVDQDWGHAILKAFAQDPDLSIIGGRVELANPNDRPVSIRTSCEKALISSFGQLMDTMIGCNFACTRRALDTIGYFDPAMGAGTRTESADDTDFLYRGLRQGLKMAYSPEILVLHNHGRRSEEAIDALRRVYSRGRGAFYCKYLLRGDKEILRNAYWEFRGLVSALTERSPETGSKSVARQLVTNLVAGAYYYLRDGCSLPVEKRRRKLRSITNEC
jgi:glycosyltransferase involved in cell wall biosynthesis